MKISIIGLGWYGAELAEVLKKEGHTIRGTTRTQEKINHFTELGITAELLDLNSTPSEMIMDTEIIVLNIPPFKEQLDWFKSWNWNKATWPIFISSTSVNNKPESDNAVILKAEEEWIKTNFNSWTILRFGGLYGKQRHPGKYLSGRKNLPDGDKPINLVHLDETLSFTLDVIQNQKMNETFTIIGSDRRSKREFYSEYCRENGLPLPEFE